MTPGARFGLLAAACLVLGAGYLIWAAVRQAAPAATLAPSADQGKVAAPGGPRQIVVRRTGLGDGYGKLALVSTEAPGQPAQTAALDCDRVYMAAGQGLCLSAERGAITTYRATSFGPDFQPRATWPLSGIPSRTRISPDGKLGAITVFVSGHSYAAGNFSVQTSLIELASGTMLVSDLEQFALLRDGVSVQAPDTNIWGVTFARDGNRFYATAATGGTPYLVEGDIAAGQLRILQANVECPSLSPDTTRVAFKRRVTRGGQTGWQLHVLDLSTRAETPLAAETRSVDDQVEWLDDGHLLYALPDSATSPSAVTNVWVLPADGSGAPQLLLPRAESPAVLR